MLCRAWSIDGRVLLHQRVDVGDGDEDAHAAVAGVLGPGELVEIARVVVVDRAPGRGRAGRGCPSPSRVGRSADAASCFRTSASKSGCRPLSIIASCAISSSSSSCLRFMAAEGITMRCIACPPETTLTLVELGDVTAAELHAAAARVRAEAGVLACIAGTFVAVRDLAAKRDCALAPRRSRRASRASCACRVAFDGADLPELLDARLARRVSRARRDAAPDRALPRIPRRLRVSRRLAGGVGDAAAADVAAGGARVVRDRGQRGRVLSDRHAGRLEPARAHGRGSRACARRRAM